MAKIHKKQIKLKINLLPTNEIFILKLIYADSLIRELRSECEISTGIPANIQQLYYLDKCDLVDNTTVQSNEIVSNAILSLDIWHNWREIVVAAAKGDISQVFSMGVTEYSKFSTPSSDILSEKDKNIWLNERANMALLIASHRGHLELSKQLIKIGANVNWCTSLGRTALHLAAARDKGDIIDLLLHSGADIDIKEANGFTAMTLANRYGHKSCERHLFMFRWQQRAKNMEYKFLDPPPMAFQLVDSFKRNWKTGPAAQFYIEKLLPPGEFMGSSFNAPKRNWHRRLSQSSLSLTSGLNNQGDKNDTKKKLSYDQWIRHKTAQQKIHDEIRKKKDETEKLIEEEKRRLRIAKWKTSQSSGDNEADIGTGHREKSNVSFTSLVPNVDTKTKIKELLLRFGLKDGEETPKTVYEQWLLHRKNMGKDEPDGGAGMYDDGLPYQHMIKEFCERRYHIVDNV